MIFQNEHGKRLNKMDFTKLAKQFGMNSMTIYRADLHKTLCEAIAPGTIHLNKRCVDFNRTELGTMVFFEDGSTAEGDLVIAADGIHSLFRNKLVANAHALCWLYVLARRCENNG